MCHDRTGANQQLSPMVTPGRIDTFAPTHTLRPLITGMQYV